MEFDVTKFFKVYNTDIISFCNTYNLDIIEAECVFCKKQVKTTIPIINREFVGLIADYCCGCQIYCLVKRHGEFFEN